MALAPHDDGAARVARIGIPERWRAGGSGGNELLTSATAVVLIALLVAEGITILDLRSLVDEHMFIGLVLIPPVLLKLGSVGYRFVRYYAGSRAYVGKGPPLLPLRVAAPLLVIATVALFTSGGLLLAAGHKSRSVLQIHQLSAIVWGAVFAVHFVAYIPRVARSLGTALRATRETAVPGADARRVVVVGAIGAGVALALALLPAITGWHRLNARPRGADARRIEVDAPAPPDPEPGPPRSIDENSLFRPAQLAQISSGLDSHSAGFHGSATNASGSGRSLEQE